VPPNGTEQQLQLDVAAATPGIPTATTQPATMTENGSVKLF